MRSASPETTPPSPPRPRSTASTWCAPTCRPRSPTPPPPCAPTKVSAAWSTPSARMKTVDLELRPVFHWTAPRVRAHVLLCMLAYYLEWHMRRSLAPMLFDEHDPAATRGAADLAGGEGQAFAGGAAQGRPQTHRSGRRRTAPGAQLPHPARRSRHPDPQCRPPRARSPHRHPRHPHQLCSAEPSICSAWCSPRRQAARSKPSYVNGLCSNGGKVRFSCARPASRGRCRVVARFAGESESGPLGAMRVRQAEDQLRPAGPRVH